MALVGASQLGRTRGSECAFIGGAERCAGFLLVVSQVVSLLGSVQFKVRIYRFWALILRYVQVAWGTFQKTL